MNAVQPPSGHYLFLPTTNVVGQCLQLAQGLIHHDYDLDCYIEECLRALHYADAYPISYTEDIYLSVEGMGHLESMTENDRIILNQMRRLIYDVLFNALRGVGAYDVHGVLKYQYSAVYQGDIVVGTQPIAFTQVDGYDSHYL